MLQLVLWLVDVDASADRGAGAGLVSLGLRSTETIDKTSSSEVVFHRKVVDLDEIYRFAVEHDS